MDNPNKIPQSGAGIALCTVCLLWHTDLYGDEKLIGVEQNPTPP